jgi:hypothetical protein
MHRRRQLSARSDRRAAAVMEARLEAVHLAQVHERAKPWMVLVELFYRMSIIQVAKPS